ncbi:MAG TPA: 4-vinyl reductase [Candidatus Wallbacteria bacterium]|nr:4-vinyl reductase [Candidatus Wallbacteria bacterium]
MFKEERKQPIFSWEQIGNIADGRPNLGKMTDLCVYRLMQFTLRDVMICELGVAKTDEIFFKAGEQAGKAFYKNVLTCKENLDDLMNNIQDKMKELNIGIFRVESADPENGHFVFTVAEDLDCSGIPVCSEEICTYDEGFISGILFEFTQKRFIVKEVDCWCSGDRVCRFDVRLK